jgi:hypothetical protein
MQLEQSNAIVGRRSSPDSPEDVEETRDSYDIKSVPLTRQTSKWTKVKAAHNRRILPRTSEGEIKLSNIIDELQKFATEEHEEGRKDEQISVTNCWNCIRLSRRRLAHHLQQPTFHYIVILLVVTDLIVVLIDLVLGKMLIY